MLETAFPSFISKNLGEILIFGTFFSEKKNQFWPIFHWKSTFSGQPCFITSFWCHTSTDFHDFGINGKRRPYPSLWYQRTILWACQFQVHTGAVTTPSGRSVTKKPSGRRGIMCHHRASNMVQIYTNGLPILDTNTHTQTKKGQCWPHTCK